MKVAIGSKNGAKVNAVKAVISSIWKDAEFVSLEVESGVRPQPLTDEEGLLGATNRATGALAKVPGATHGIGLEATVQENQYGMFLCGWVVIIDQNGTTGVGSGGRAMLPKFIQEEIRKGKELGPIIQELMRDTNDEIRHSNGAFGVLTNGLVTRTGQFEEAIKMALAIFISPQIYKKTGP